MGKLIFVNRKDEIVRASPPLFIKRLEKVIQAIGNGIAMGID